MEKKKVWPIAFAEDGRIWASNGMYYGYDKWWALSNIGRESTKPSVMVKNAKFAVVMVSKDNLCWVRNRDGEVFFTNKDEELYWYKSNERELNTYKGAANFTPNSNTNIFNTPKPKPAVRKASVYVPSESNWFVMSKGSCYFCNISECEHMDRLK